ncbi:hypothetical protein CRE_00673 [Caenorhabditis remanei]|uniref:phospholipase A2 n=1 Tax=Caenorhabditis remanei TaxID=31234 RepID=E3LDR2_CAERE|nr:hypothetical protein CRE_00673 [Caenorhabditis remanei]
MDFLKKLAKSDAGQMAMNMVRQNVEEKFKEYTASQQNSVGSTSQSGDTEGQPLWPGPVNKSLPFAIEKKLSSNFSRATYGDGYALVYTPTNYIVYANDDSTCIDHLEYLWKEFDECVLQHNDPVKLIDDLVPAIIREKEQQSDCLPVFFAIVAGFSKYVKQQQEKGGTRFSMSKLNKRGDTPVHVAAEYGTIGLLQCLWDECFDPLTINQNGETILQVARSRPDIIKYITKNVKGEVFDRMILTTENHPTPLEPKYPKSFESILKYTIDNNLPHCLFAPGLLISSSKFSFRDLETVLKILYIQDSDFLGRLHKSQNIFHNINAFSHQQQKLIMSFAKLEMLNVQDSDGLTPIHCIAKSGSVETFLTMWSYGADINLLTNNGQYPMDYALVRDDLDLVKAFLAFDGKYSDRFMKDAVNQKSRKCSETLKKHFKALEETKNNKIEFNNSDPTHRRCKNFPAIKKDDRIVLSIDGGGMKGILALQLLKEIEKIVGNHFLKRFNHIGGTSTGSMITLGLVQYGNIDHVIRQYFRMKDEIFIGSRPYSGEGLENALINEFGRDTLKQLGEKNNIRVCIPVARVDISPPQLYMFRSYDLRDPVFEKDSSNLNWCAAKVVRSSSAAPSFFPPVDGKFMDGGLIANNPSIDILTDCQRLEFERNERNTTKIIVSVGTGAMEKKIDNIDLMKPTTMGGIINTFNQVLHLKDVFIEQLTASDGVTVERARWMAEAMGMAFFRFTPNLEFPVAIDEKKDGALIDAMLAVKYEAITMRNEMLMLASIFK